MEAPGRTSGHESIFIQLYALIIEQKGYIIKDKHYRLTAVSTDTPEDIPCN